MTRIGITQRVSSRFHGQPHDCLDQAWTDLLLHMGYVPLPLPNLAGSEEAVAAYLSGLELDGLILSGGNDIAGQGDAVGSEASERRDAFERAAIGWARRAALPVLGVCRGMQFLNVVLGGSLVRVEGHAGTRHQVRRVAGIADGTASCFSDLPERFEVNSFHNFAVSPDGLAQGLVAVVTDEAGQVEAFAHAGERIAAIMWHPERSVPFNLMDMMLMDRLLRGDHDGASSSRE